LPSSSILERYSSGQSENRGEVGPRPTLQTIEEKRALLAEELRRKKQGEAEKAAEIAPYEAKVRENLAMPLPMWAVKSLEGLNTKGNTRRIR
jgi:hypothetical protein